MKVVGCEGSPQKVRDLTLFWGCAAIEKDRQLVNGYFVPSHTPLLELTDVITPLDAFIELPEDAEPGIFVLALRHELAARRPYRITRPQTWGILGQSTGKVYTYFAFQSHKLLTLWLESRMVGPFELVNFQKMQALETACKQARDEGVSLDPETVLKMVVLAREWG